VQEDYLTTAEIRRWFAGSFLETNVIRNGYETLRPCPGIFPLQSLRTLSGSCGASSMTKVKMGERSMKHASNMLVVLLYAQGLLGFAGLASVVVKDWAHSEPIFVHGVAQGAAAR
jgi:hypothetical protein